jgi:hypothetical protein
MTPDDALAEVRARSAGRTRYEGHPPSADEVLAEEVERLREQVAELTASFEARGEVLRMVATTSVKRARRITDLTAALEFYADPETYYGIGFLADSPCGEFAQDFSDDHGDDTLPGPRPGARARRALGEESL